MTVMMKCGHAANAVITGTSRPCCAICWGIVPGADVIDDSPPDLTGRVAHCAYYRTCKSEEPSSTELAFFMHHPDKPFDEYYCGCHGWD